MQIMALLRRRTEAFTDAQFDELAGPEAERARGLYAEGIVRALWSRADMPGAVLLLEAENAEDAGRAVASLPFAARDMVEVQLIDLRPYRGIVPR